MGDVIASERMCERKGGEICDLKQGMSLRLYNYITVGRICIVLSPSVGVRPRFLGGALSEC